MHFSLAKLWRSKDNSYKLIFELGEKGSEFHTLENVMFEWNGAYHLIKWMESKLLLGKSFVVAKYVKKTC